MSQVTAARGRVPWGSKEMTMKTPTLIVSLASSTLLAAFSLEQINKVPGPTESVVRLLREKDRTTVILEGSWDYGFVGPVDNIPGWTSAGLRPTGAKHKGNF